MNVKTIISGLFFMFTLGFSFAQEVPTLKNTEANNLILKLDKIKTEYITAIQSDNVEELINLQSEAKSLIQKSKALTGKISAEDSKKFQKYMDDMKEAIKNAAQ